MEIASSSIQMRASHASFSATRITQRLDAWSGQSNQSAQPPAPESSRVSLSQPAANIQEVAPVDNQDDSDGLDPRLRLMANMIELITGKPVKFLRMADLTSPASAGSSGQNVPPSATPEGTNRQGAGFEFSMTATRMEFESVQFSAEGVIKTKDGQEIRFNAAFAMERSHFETLNIELRGGEARLKDPLVLDFGGASASLKDTRFEFDLSSDGNLESLPMLGGGRGFLAIDRDGNGRIDNGRELFGPTSGDGFAELAALDSDGNGWIDAADPGFAQLRLWKPDENGGGSLMSMEEAGVGALYLGRVSTPFELRNSSNQTLGVMRSSSIYVAQDGRVGTVSQIDLAV